jgi:hypothetical protein
VSYYLDTSAAVKLVKRELESDALVTFFRGSPKPPLEEPWWREIFFAPNLLPLS